MTTEERKQLKQKIVRCKKAIPAARLMFIPQSNRCVHCAER
ncbi:MAG: TraR/DksA C4-type zinc finger protein [Lewinella sp.]|nr:TraR/DksA C4-type zinc finger protein [Lewinella sp.]